MSFGGGSAPPPPPAAAPPQTVPLRQLTEVPSPAPNVRSFMDAGAAASFMSDPNQQKQNQNGSTILGGG
jgi:hypothetical protein